MFERQKNWLLALFYKLRELSADPIGKRILALEIQEQLIKRISRAERLIRRIRRANEEIKKQLTQRQTKEVAERAKLVYRVNEGKIDAQKNLISCLRSVGDSIAFIYGNRWDLKQFAFKQDSGFITGKKGARLERKILRGAFGIGAAAVLNDLTHTMRHGDITAFHPDLSLHGGSPCLLIEAKSGRGGSRARTLRQKEAAESILIT
jgi:hypothetical protein